MSQNCQTHFKNVTAFAARLLRYVWPFQDIIYFKVKREKLIFISSFQALSKSFDKRINIKWLKALTVSY